MAYQTGNQDSHLNRLLRQCRETWAVRRQTLTWWDWWTYLRLARPAWCTRSDRMMEYFHAYQRVLKQGQLVWGHIIQVNALMFEPGPMSCPGEVVFGVDPVQQPNPAQLEEIAHAIGTLKGTTPASPDLRHIADYLTDEYTRVFGLPVPPSLSRGWRCEISTIYFPRWQLPGRQMLGPLLPLLIDEVTPRVAIMLPGRYWPDELLAWWTASA